MGRSLEGEAGGLLMGDLKGGGEVGGLTLGVILVGLLEGDSEGLMIG
jgi:hypothetical protein